MWTDSDVGSTWFKSRRWDTRVPRRPSVLRGQLGDPKRLDTSGSMKLSEKFPPGDYVLQIVVTDKLAKEKIPDGR